MQDQCKHHQKDEDQTWECHHQQKPPLLVERGFRLCWKSKNQITIPLYAPSKFSLLPHSERCIYNSVQEREVFKGGDVVYSAVKTFEGLADTSKTAKRTGAYYSSNTPASIFHTPRAALQNPLAKKKLSPSEEREVSSHSSTHLRFLTTAVLLVLPGSKEPLIDLSWLTIIPLFKRLASLKCCSVALWKIQLVPGNKVHLVQCLSVPPLTPISNIHCYLISFPHQLSRAWCAAHGYQFSCLDFVRSQVISSYLTSIWDAKWN